MNDKGMCKLHGEFILADGCPQCIQERRQAGISPAQDEMETGLRAEGLTLAHAEEPAAETALALRPGEDMEAHGYFEEALRCLDFAEKRVITTIENVEAATDDLALISKLKKVMENKRKSLLDPLKLEVDAIRATYDYLMVPILQADRLTREKILAFDAEQKRIRREQEEINRKRQEAAEAEMRLKGELTESVNLVEVSAAAPKRVETDMGTSGVAKIWKFEVIDFSLLPDRFKMENATLIGKVVRAGEREIPGVKIWSEDTLRVTAR